MSRPAIGFAGGEYAESFTLADVRLSGEAPDDEVILFYAMNGLNVLAPLPGGIHRIVAPSAHAPEVPSAEFVQDIMDTRGFGPGRSVVTELVWGSRFRIQHRVADTYRAGRLLLAGDAAHVHSPAGGQGMNLGIQDAVALADALRDALHGGSDAALDAYSAGRRPIARASAGRDGTVDPAGDAAQGGAPGPQRVDATGRTDPRGPHQTGLAAIGSGLPLNPVRRRPSGAPRSAAAQALPSANGHAA